MEIISLAGLIPIKAQHAEDIYDQNKAILGAWKSLHNILFCKITINLELVEYRIYLMWTL